MTADRDITDKNPGKSMDVIILRCMAQRGWAVDTADAPLLSNATVLDPAALSFCSVSTSSPPAMTTAAASLRKKCATGALDTTTPDTAPVFWPAMMTVTAAPDDTTPVALPQISPAMAMTINASASAVVTAVPDYDTTPVALPQISPAMAMTIGASASAVVTAAPDYDTTPVASSQISPEMTMTIGASASAVVTTASGCDTTALSPISSAMPINASAGAAPDDATASSQISPAMANDTVDAITQDGALAAWPPSASVMVNTAGAVGATTHDGTPAPSAPAVVNAAVAVDAITCDGTDAWSLTAPAMVNSAGAADMAAIDVTSAYSYSSSSSPSPSAVTVDASGASAAVDTAALDGTSASSRSPPAPAVINAVAVEVDTTTRGGISAPLSRPIYAFMHVEARPTSTPPRMRMSVQSSPKMYFSGPWTAVLSLRFAALTTPPACMYNATQPPDVPTITSVRSDEDGSLTVEFNTPAGTPAGWQKAMVIDGANQSMWQYDSPHWSSAELLDDGINKKTEYVNRVANRVKLEMHYGGSVRSVEWSHNLGMSLQQIIGRICGLERSGEGVAWHLR
jgi:hypothetical protein